VLGNDHDHDNHDDDYDHNDDNRRADYDYDDHDHDHTGMRWLCVDLHGRRVATDRIQLHGLVYLFLAGYRRE
jgi:ABC-type Zn2+ transport system substrate-binding protein/surface adhesin